MAARSYPIELELEANTSYTAVAHLAEDGTPSAALFPNDISKTEAGQGRLTVRHTAAAPEVDILAGGEPVAEGLSTGDEATLDLDAGTVSAGVALAGETEPVIGPADVEVTDGVLTIVYACGSAEDGNLDLAVQTIEGLHSSPDGVEKITRTGKAELVDAGVCERTGSRGCTSSPAADHPISRAAPTATT